MANGNGKGLTTGETVGVAVGAALAAGLGAALAAAFTKGTAAKKTTAGPRIKPLKGCGGCGR